MHSNYWLAAAVVTLNEENKKKANWNHWLAYEMRNYDITRLRFYYVWGAQAIILGVYVTAAVVHTMPNATRFFLSLSLKCSIELQVRSDGEKRETTS